MEWRHCGPERWWWWTWTVWTDAVTDCENVIRRPVKLLHPGRHMPTMFHMQPYESIGLIVGQDNLETGA